VVEELLRIPLILRGPGIRASTTIDRQTQLIDLAPTLLELLSVPVPDTFMGRSMAPLLDGATTDGVPWVFSSAMHGGGRSSRVGTPDTFRIISCRGEPWKYIRDDEGPTEELYDLRQDPGERRNVAAENSHIVHEMRRRVAEHDEQVAARSATLHRHTAGRINEGDEEVRRRLADLGYL
jgi:arylsulfatase A-like enzyme